MGYYCKGTIGSRHTCTKVDTLLYMYVYVYMYMCLCPNMYICVCIIKTLVYKDMFSVCVYVCMYACMYACSLHSKVVKHPLACSCILLQYSYMHTLL